MHRPSLSIPHVVPALLAVTFLANCSVNKAMDATQSVPDKVDATNDQVKQTNAEVKKTNQGMETMIGEVKQTNASMEVMTGEVKKTNSNMDTMIGEVRKTNEGMAKTNLAVHRQTLQAALSDLLRDDNTRFLAPPTAMMPGAQIFALEATPDELMQLVYVYLNFVEKTPATEKDRAAPDSVGSFNRAKIVRLTAASVITGLAPQSTIDEIVRTQIVQAGPYRDAAIALLMLRAQYLQQWIIGPKIEQGLTTPGMVEETIVSSDALAAITTLPFADQIGIKFTGFLGDDMARSVNEATGQRPTLNESYSATLNTKIAMSFWKKIKVAIDKLDPKYSDPKSDTVQRVTEAKAKVLARIQAGQPAVGSPAPAVASPSPAPAVMATAGAGPNRADNAGRATGSGISATSLNPRED